MSEPIVYTYRGEDRFYGVPRRSLTQSEFDSLTPLQQKDVIASKSYVARTAEAKPQAPPATTPNTGGKE